MVKSISDIKIELLCLIVINLFAIIEKMNLIGTKTRNSIEYQEIKKAIQDLKDLK